MSKPRYKWWSYVKWMIRLHPERVAELRRRQEAAVTARYGGSGGRGSDTSRTTEALGTITLGRPADREMDAVRLAIEETSAMRDGQLRLQLVDLVFWKKSHTLMAACDDLHISERTGQRWHAEFITTVARNFGLL